MSFYTQQSQAQVFSRVLFYSRGPPPQKKKIKAVTMIDKSSEIKEMKKKIVRCWTVFL